MTAEDALRSALDAAVQGAAPGLAAADALCRACVELLDVDGAAISLFHEGKTYGTFGSCGELSRQLDELQFTYGEGPCSEAMKDDRIVLVAELDADQRWPAYAGAVLALGIRAVFALPVTVSAAPIGVLDLFRTQPGALCGDDLTGAVLAAELAALPLLDLMTADVDWSQVAESRDGWSQLASLERVEVYQATGMIMGQFEVGPTEALVRLRALAFARGMTASAVSWQIVEGHLVVENDASWRLPPPDQGAPS